MSHCGICIHSNKHNLDNGVICHISIIANYMARRTNPKYVCCNCISLNNKNQRPYTSTHHCSACSTDYIIFFVAQELFDIIPNHDNKNNMLCDIYNRVEVPFILMIAVRLCCGRTHKKKQDAEIAHYRGKVVRVNLLID